MTEPIATGPSWWQLIDERARLTPDRPFLSDESGRCATFGEFRHRAELTAAGLHDHGITADEVVSWQLPTTLEAAVLMAALSRLGARQNPIIPILRTAEVKLITSQLGSRWLIVPGTYRGFDHVEMAHEAVAGSDCAVIDASRWAIGTDALALPTGDASALAPDVDPGDAHDPARDQVRWYYYSSGTTATAKGAKHTDRSAMAASNAQIAYLGLHEDDLLPVPFPITHIGGLMLLTTYMRVGARLLLMEAFDPVASPILMAERGATLLGSATPFFQAYLAAQRRHGDTPMFPKLRQLQAGGAPITPELNAECIRVLGTPIFNQWGLTEFPAATSLSPGDPPEKFNGSVGRMAPGAQVKVVGFDGGVITDGGEGELWVRGPQRCQGYVDSSLDGDAFDADGYFRTGDLGTVDADGFVRITGRLKDIIIRNAENLSAQEIEDVLAEHPAVADVAVVGVPDPNTGERACAIAVLAVGYETLTIPELAEHCSAAGLAKQKIPEQLVTVDELPRNAMGKVLKHILRKQVGPAS
jgi:cyclohexanecarboxylate-CoA ligase